MQVLLRANVDDCAEWLQRTATRHNTALSPEGVTELQKADAFTATEKYNPLHMRVQMRRMHKEPKL